MTAQHREHDHPHSHDHHDHGHSHALNADADRRLPDDRASTDAIASLFVAGLMIRSGFVVQRKAIRVCGGSCCRSPAIGKVYAWESLLRFLRGLHRMSLAGVSTTRLSDAVAAAGYTRRNHTAIGVGSRVDLHGDRVCRSAVLLGGCTRLTDNSAVRCQCAFGF